jgi:pimeloyl-ACP methyl ester carboxylesterase
MKCFKKTVFAVLGLVLVMSPVFAKGAKETSQEAVQAGGFALAVSTEAVPLERNGIKLYLAKYETADGIQKKPILFIHGLTYSSHEFDVDYGDYSLVRYFANNGYTVWLLDIAGYGSSGEVTDGFIPNSDYAAEDIAAAVQLITQVSGIPQIDVLGWSWGTVTGGRFAAKYPELVNKLVLYAPIVAGLADVQVTDPFHANDWYHAADDFQVKADKTIDFAIVEPPVAHIFLSNCWRYDGKGSPNGGRRDLLVAPTERLIPTGDIKAPTLLILGDKDPYVSVALAEEALGTLENGKLKVINGAAHAMMMEKPSYREFRESILEFLK